MCQHVTAYMDLNTITPSLVITHSQQEAYMDLVENGGGGGHQQAQEPQGM